MKIGIIGATGYTGVELMRLLAWHPLRGEVSVVTSRQEQGKALTDIFPALSGLSNYDQLKYEAPEARELAGRADIFFMAAPHGAAMGLAPALIQNGARIIDLSADFRLRQAEVFQKWYQEHTAPELLPQAVYGLPELYAEEIKKAALVANPGCYPTSVILGLAPLLKKGPALEDLPIIADSTSGVTGAGRGGALGTSFCEVSDNFKAYKPVGHRHTPEIEQELSALAGRPILAAFTPHLAPMNRGILSTIYVRPQKAPPIGELRELYLSFYAKDPFVRVRPQGFEPQTADVRGSNFCDISLFFDERTKLLKIVSVIDNLCRGASGQAVRNYNLMTGHAESAGFLSAPLRP